MVQKHRYNGNSYGFPADNIHPLNELRSVKTQIQGQKGTDELYAHPWNVPRIPYEDPYI